jgi:hypothetical protein
MSALHTGSTVLACSPRLSWRVLDGQVLILCPEEGTLHRLNETGTRVWELLDGARTLEDVAVALTTEYEITAAEVLEQLLPLTDELRRAALVEVQR